MDAVSYTHLTAFAYVDESVATEEPAGEEKVPETEPEEPMLPLTPDGNLTLVDDAGSPTKSGKQFITAVTKNGNYFYIITVSYTHLDVSKRQVP